VWVDVKPTRTFLKGALIALIVCSSPKNWALAYAKARLIRANFSCLKLV